MSGTAAPAPGADPAPAACAEVLLPYQQRWVADAADLKLAEKSRRTGLTWAEAADAVLAASAAPAAGGCDHFYVGSGKDMAVEFVEACAMWARLFQRAAEEVEEAVLQDGDRAILTYTIRFASRFKIVALSSRPSNLRGRQGNVTIDEAAFHDQLPEVLKAAAALTMWGGKVRVISTHNGDGNPFNDLLRDSRAGKKDYRVHRVTLDDACRDGLYRRICQKRRRAWSAEAEAAWKAGLMRSAATREDALEEYQCVPKRGGGAYLSRALIEARMTAAAPVLRYAAPAGFEEWPETARAAELAAWCAERLDPLLAALDPQLPHAFGLDFGRSADLTVLAPLALERDLGRRAPFLVELRNVPFKQQEQLLFHVADRLPRLLAGALDARGNGQYLAEQAVLRYGSGRIAAVMLSQAWYLEQMPKFKAAFEDGLIAVPRDLEVLDDLRALQVLRGVPKLPDAKTGSGRDRHGDAAIALALAWHAAGREVELFAYRPVPKRAPDGGRDSLPRRVRATAGFRRGAL